MNGKKIFDFKGLKFKLWTYFLLFAAGIMIVLWLLQIIFINTYYESMKMRQVEKIGNHLVSQYEDSDIYQNLLEQISFRNGLMIRIVDENGEPILSNNIFNRDNNRDKNGRMNPYEFNMLKSRIQNNGEKTVCFVQNDEGMRMHTVVFGAVLQNDDGSKAYLSMYAPLAPIDATTQVLQNQLLIVTILSLVFAFILSYFIANRLARPISKITKSAGKLAKGDYSVVFEHGDYTEVNQLAEVLNYTTQELSKTDELRRDLIANVSHDLRTPLTIIKSYAEMIRDLSGDNPVKRQVHTQVIVDESDRLSGLVSDMLDLSKLESGTLKLNISRFDMAETVKEIINRFAVYQHRDGYVITSQCEEEAWVEADQLKISQVVYNLIGNAINYTGEDKTVHIAVHVQRGKVRFSVSDSGEGIPKEEIDRVWERYYKSSQRHKRAAVGTGIGLSIVKNILLLHHAEFGVNSKVHKGSTFWFSLNKSDGMKEDALL